MPMHGFPSCFLTSPHCSSHLRHLLQSGWSMFARLGRAGSLLFQQVANQDCTRILNYSRIVSTQLPYCILWIDRHHYNWQQTSQIVLVSRWATAISHSQFIHTPFTIHSRVKRLQPIARRAWSLLPLLRNAFPASPHYYVTIDVVFDPCCHCYSSDNHHGKTTK